MRDAIEWDLVEEAFPGLSEGAGTPGEYARRVRDARRMLSQDHVDALFLELRDQPKFMYFSGNETHTCMFGARVIAPHAWAKRPSPVGSGRNCPQPRSSDWRSAT